MVAVAAVVLALAAPATDLRVTVWPAGRAGRSVAWTLRCGPPGGTLPGVADACRRLGALRAPFAPVPKDAMCTQQYGGPAVARVTGRFRGRPVAADLNRRNGCEIARWNAVRFLLRGR